MGETLLMRVVMRVLAARKTNDKGFVLLTVRCAADLGVVFVSPASKSIAAAASKGMSVHFG